MFLVSHGEVGYKSGNKRGSQNKSGVFVFGNVDGAKSKNKDKNGVAHEVLPFGGAHKKTIV